MPPLAASAAPAVPCNTVAPPCPSVTCPWFPPTSYICAGLFAESWKLSTTGAWGSCGLHQRHDRSSKRYISASGLAPFTPQIAFDHSRQHSVSESGDKVSKGTLQESQLAKIRINRGYMQCGIGMRDLICFEPAEQGPSEVDPLLQVHCTHTAAWQRT